jgi:RNA polymerase sigma factor (sigma-70 family)
MMNWAMIISGCAKGDTRYQKLLYEEYYSILMKVAFRYVSTYEQALELTQNGFLIIFHEFSGFRADQYVITKEALFAWVKRTFIITLVDHIKSSFDLHMPQTIPWDIWKQNIRPFTDREMMNIKLIKILKGLPTLYRLVYNMHIIDGFSHGEIAAIFGISIQGSRQNLTKAREYLNKSLEVISLAHR